MIFQMKFSFKPLNTKGSLKVASHAGNDEIRSLRKIIAKLDEDGGRGENREHLTKSF